AIGQSADPRGASMDTATRDTVKRAVRYVGLFVAAFLLPCAPAAADAGPADDGVFINVYSPITTEVVNRVKARTALALARKDRSIRTLIYDFNPDGSSCTRSFGECSELANYLRQLQDVKTVAFVHHSVTGHTVLPVLACSDIIMSRDAELGDALKGQTEPLP